ncbi:hypothetical protein LG291_23370 [Cytobacillus firmus]|uniref:hypothetical protein n=1 Tax=Cytobacillus firmus TaxID=1399 RepID=UPI00384FF55C
MILEYWTIVCDIESGYFFNFDLVEKDMDIEEFRFKYECKFPQFTFVFMGKGKTRPEFFDNLPKITIVRGKIIKEKRD